MIKNAFVIGDIHGDFKPIRNFYKTWADKANISTKAEENLMICLGDFGANFFFNHRDTEYKKKLGKYPFTYFVIRGNHEQRPSIIAKDNPDWQIENYLDGLVYVEKEYPYIKYAMDMPEVYEYRLLSMLIIPGAYSVDKYRRLQKGWSWFEQEQLTPEEREHCMNILKNKQDFNFILSHTCPQILEPTDLFLPVVDQSTVDKTMELWLNKVYSIVDYNLWFFGHYHDTRYYSKVGAIMLYATPVFNLNHYIETQNVMKSFMVWEESYALQFIY